MSDEVKENIAVSNDTSVEAAIAKLPSRLANVRILDIRENTTALRGVDRTNPEYIELLESVKVNGVIETITVRDKVDPVTKAKYYELINGLQRFNAAKDAGFDNIDVKVVDANDFEVLMMQIILNAKRVETTPGQYSEQLKRMLTARPSMTLKEMSECLSASEGFIYDRLSLLKLNNEIAKLVDTGDIILTNAYAIAKLPPDEQLAFKDRAVSMEPKEFVPETTKRVKELNAAKKKGQDAPKEEWAPQPRQRKLEELKQEFHNPTVGKELIIKENITDLEAAFQLGIRWALHMDVVSIAQSKAKAEARVKEAEEAKARKAEEKAEKDANNIVAKVMGIA